MNIITNHLPKPTDWKVVRYEYLGWTKPTAEAYAKARATGEQTPDPQDWCALHAERGDDLVIYDYLLPLENMNLIIIHPATETETEVNHV